ncbi:MAG TPA: FlgD immunoglobulin-like domain containing protein [Candidatus Eisenbacteria bacterium]
MVLGADLWLGSPTQVGSFKSQTGVSFPLLLCGNRCIGGTGICATTGSNCANLETLYGPYDNYLVINKQGIVRYHAANLWPHGNRYHLDEIRGCVDTLVSAVVGVEEAANAGPALRVAPNPFRGSIAIELSNPAGASRRVRVTVHDLAGREVARPFDGLAGAGRTRLEWDGRGPGGLLLGAGLYLVRAEVGAAVLVRRVVWLR